jgi:hypothetical protein
MKRILHRDGLVIDQGDFYEVEDSGGLFFVAFKGELGQSDPRRVLLDHFGVGEVDSPDEEPFRYEALFETLPKAQKDLISKCEAQASEEDEELCSRCESRPILKDDLCAPCHKMVSSLKGVSE